MKQAIMAFVASLLMAAPTLADEINVSGTGFVTAVPDVATFNVAIVGKDLSAGEAMKECLTKSKSLGFLLTSREGALDKKDLATTSLDMTPTYERDPRGNRGRFTGYQVVHFMSITVRGLGPDATHFTKVLDMASKNGHRINHISFSISNTKELIVKARAKAVADAMEKARHLAELSGVELGDATSINLSSSHRQVRPGAYDAVRPSGSSVFSGQRQVRVMVHMTFAIGSEE